MRNGTTPLVEREAAPQAFGPAPRAPKRSAASRMSGGHLLMIVAGLIAFVTTFALLQNRGATITIAVAKSDLTSGTELTVDNVRAEKIAEDTPIQNEIVRYDDVKNGGSYATRQIRSGEPVTKSAISTKPAASDQRVMAIPVDSVKAVGGSIGVGDRIDVIWVPKGANDPFQGCRLLANAEVLSVAKNESGGFSGGGEGSNKSGSAGYQVTVALSEANRDEKLASGYESGALHVVLATGAREATADCEKKLSQGSNG